MSRFVSLLAVGAGLLLGSSAAPTENQQLEVKDGVDSTVTALAGITPTATPTTIPG
jgi:hypothetical protein